MGQALNTVTCPVCNYSSRNFDPFNLLSIPIPTVADAVFQCTVVRRSTPRNCPWILNKPPKGDSRPNRFPESLEDKNSPLQPPSEFFSCEQYVIALSRLADGGDLRLQIQNLSGIRADQLRLCRAEVISVNNQAGDDGVTKRYVKVVPLSDKEGPASQLLKARAPNDESSRLPTLIVAFEMSVNPRLVDKGETKHSSIRDTDVTDDEEYPSLLEIAEIERYLAVYGDEKECRFVDTHPLVLAKALSKSLWPRSESELRIGLRVDAQDHRGNWYTGSVVDIFDDEVNGGDADTGQEVAIQQKKVRVHFDNFLPKWDEIYTIEHFKKGRVNPLCSFAEPKMKQTEFIGYHRYTDRSKGQPFLFGQSFFIQCQNEWSNVRAGAHILAQSSRFLSPPSESADLIRLFDKVHGAISELIDFLVEIDREYILRALGVSPQSTEERLRPYRNPSFDSATFAADANKRIVTLLNRLPFEIRLCSSEPSHSIHSEEIPFPLVLNKTVGNFVSTRNAIVLHWREPSVEKKSGPVLRGVPSILYVEPVVQVHAASAAMLRHETTNGTHGGGATQKAGVDRTGEIDLQYCLTEFCKVQKLSMSDNWVCPRCKVIREGGQNMNLWRIPDLLTFHIKRFNMSARWHEKITTMVNFPLTGLDLSEWCHPESPVLQDGATKDASCIYDLIGVMNHYGSLTGGHYVATCKATWCGRDGTEEVAYSFNGAGSRGHGREAPESAWEEPTGSWVGLGRPKQPKGVPQSRLDAALASKAVAESAEPMWLQFDDEVVEAIPPRLVVSEMAYVLFYRKRHLTSSNIAKYSTFE
jgi:Ubiquitin carboxyl-terminal hydrolase